MCLLTYQTKVKITDKDLVVYKIFANSEYHDVNPIKEAVSYFELFKYKIGDLYSMSKLEITIDSDSGGVFDEDTLFYIGSSKPYNSVTYGFHAFTSKKLIHKYYKNDNSVVTYKCIIPKGSQIVRNKFNIIVSNQIIIKERI